MDDDEDEDEELSVAACSRTAVISFTLSLFSPSSLLVEFSARDRLLLLARARNTDIL